MSGSTLRWIVDTAAALERRSTLPSVVDADLMQHPDYVVLRASPDLPEGWMPQDLDGRWYDRNRVPLVANPNGAPSMAAAEPSGRFEVREDGAVAEVWEVRPHYREGALP